ncbi:MAG: NusG domain II-containing protein [Clostridia bacterium]|nr:NusG domain II-containing protein [Clostridia bacterium]
MLVNQNGNRTFLPRLRFTLWDGITVLLILVLAVCLLIRPGAVTGSGCVVTWDGGEVTLPLSEPKVLTIESRGILLTVTVADGGVSVTEAGCPDRVCEKTGVIRHAGEIIVCVPADVIVRIPGETAEDCIAG